MPSRAPLLAATVTITNLRGLHARAAAKFVKLAGQFDATVIVSRKDMQVSGVSIMGLMMLAAAPGCDITIETAGKQAQEALAALSKLVEDKFDEA